MSQERIAELARKTREYMDSPEGRRAWRENLLAHGYSYPQNLVAAIQSANPHSRIVRFETLEAIAAAVGEGVKGGLVA